MKVILGIIKKAILGFSILAGIFALYLFIVAIMPGISAPAQPLKKVKRQTGNNGRKLSGPKREVRFGVKGTSLSAWLYLPANLSGPTPCIVMGHGLGGTKDMGLEAYAAHFQEAGFAVLAFDYRYFGGSEGEPRQLIWIPDQLEDWSAAISYARSLKEIDPARIALWGTSFSGGHVIVIAARDHRIACVSAQCPGLDGRASAEMAFKREGINFAMIMHAQRDLVRSWLGLSPHKVPIVGKPGTLALMTTTGAYDTFQQLVPDNFINEACARIIIRGDKYRPFKQARQVQCPVLLQICDDDDLTPINAAEETANLLGPYAEVKRYPLGHFDIYLGENFKKSVRDQLEFFKNNL